METKVVYFENFGAENTDTTLALARQRAQELGIKTVVLASTSGRTAIKAVDVFKGMKVIAVTHAYGLMEPNKHTFDEANRKPIEDKGGIILTATLTFGGVSRALHRGTMPDILPHYVPGDILADALRMFCQGMKVACEIVPMAADAGLVRTDEEVIAIAGTGRGGGGADTAIVMQPANTNRFFEMKIKEIICKPRL